MDEGEKGEGVFLVAGGDATKVFKLVEEAFDAIALGVFIFIIRNGLDAIGSAGITASMPSSDRRARMALLS